jgi:hypothetical protein
MHAILEGVSAGGARVEGCFVFLGGNDDDLANCRQEQRAGGKPQTAYGNYRENDGFNVSLELSIIDSIHDLEVCDVDPLCMFLLSDPLYLIRSLISGIHRLKRAHRLVFMVLTGKTR